MPSCPIHKVKCPECGHCPYCMDSKCEHKNQSTKIKYAGCPGRVCEEDKTPDQKHYGTNDTLFYTKQKEPILKIIESHGALMEALNLPMSVNNFPNIKTLWTKAAMDIDHWSLAV